MDLTYRRARAGEAEAASRILSTALFDLAARQHDAPFEAPPEHAAPVLRHLIETDGSRFWLAFDGPRPVAFGSGWVRGLLSYCGGLFVLPEWQGMGVGRRLFELALMDLPAAGGVAALTSSAANPISNRLYARHAVYPMFALLRMTGTPIAPAILPAGPAGVASRRRPVQSSEDGLEAEPLADTCLGALKEIDEAVLGIDRSVDHRWHLGAAANRGWLFRRGGQLAGYVYIGGDGTKGAGAIGPVAAIRAEDQTAMLRLALVDLAFRGVELSTVVVPGPNITAQRLFWDAGFSFSGAARLLCMSRPFGRFDRYLLAGDALM